MDSTLFLSALIPKSQAQANLEWLVDDDSKFYQQVDPLDFSTEWLNCVFKLYENSYKPYVKKGIPPLFDCAEQLLKYNRWILIYDDNDSSMEVVCFFLYTVTEYGLKAGLTGSNGEKSVNSLLRRFKINSLNEVGIFGEVSGRLEEIIINDVPIIDFLTAKRILNSLGKKDINLVKDNHYTRCIGQLGTVRKIMVGKPYVNDSE